MNRKQRRLEARIARRTDPRGKLSRRAIGLRRSRLAYAERDKRRAAAIREAAGMGPAEGRTGAT